MTLLCYYNKIFFVSPLHFAVTSRYFVLFIRLGMNGTLGLFKGCVRYIFACLLFKLKEITWETWTNISCFTSKALFFLEKIKF